jgi:hypothetical protein
MKHLTEEELILLNYREDAGCKDAAQHLESCAQCRAELQSLRNVLAVVSATPAPARHENFGSEIWRQIEPELTKRPARARSRLEWWPRWAWAMATLLIATFLVGRLSSPKPAAVATSVAAPSATPRDPSGSTRILLTEIGDHLERSQLALIDLLNSKTEAPVNLASEKILARELVEMNRLFRRASSDKGDTATAVVLDDLERALVEIANAPGELNAEEFAELRQRVGGDSLVFKVRIVAQQVRAREKFLAQQNTRR